MIETQRITNPYENDFDAIVEHYNQKESSRGSQNRLKKFGKAVFNTVRTMLMSKEKLDQQIEAARADLDASSKDYHEYRLDSGDNTELLAITPQGNVLTADHEVRLRAERFNAANETMTGLEKQRFTRRIARPVLMAAGIVGGAVAAWQFRDAAFLHTAVEHAQLTHGSGVDFLPATDAPSFSPDVFTLPVESSTSGLIAGEGDSYWGIATELWQQKGVERPDIGQINDVKNVLMQHGPSHPNGHLYPGDIVDPSAAQAFINNAIGVK